jgi:peptide/nickel transport system permease protein
MWRYLAGRLGSSAITVFGVVSLVFVLLRVLPGDPAEVMAGESATATDLARLRLQLGSGDPLLLQYGRYLADVAQLDFGRSFASGTPVIALIAERLPATLLLAGSAFMLSVLIAFPAGMLAAAWPGSKFDHASRALAVLATALPNFWLAPLYILVFSLWLRWTPVAGSDTPAHLILPSLTLAFGISASLARLIRTTVLERLQHDYIRTALSKGASPLRVFGIHALRNAALPIVSVMGVHLGHLMAGAVITETIFAWPGIGRLLVSSLAMRDYALTQGCVLVIALSYVLINLLTDLCYAAIDPRIRLPR